MEALGIALGVAGVLQPGFQACRSLWKGWELTQAFGSGLEEQRRNLEVQITMLEVLSNRKLRNLKNPSFDPWDEDDRITRAVLDLLTNMRSSFIKCDSLIKKNAGMEMSNSDDNHHDVSTSYALTDEQLGPHTTWLSGANGCEPKNERALGIAASVSKSSAKDHERKVEDVIGQAPSKEQPTRLNQVANKINSLMRRHTKPKETHVARLGGTSGHLITNHLEPSVSQPPFAKSESEPDTLASRSRQKLIAQERPASTMPAILNSTIVTKATECRKNRAMLINDANSFRRKAIWAAEDMDLLDKEITKIWEAYQKLDKFLDLATPDTFDYVLGDNKGGDSLLGNLKSVQSVLTRLHKSLASINSDSPEDRVTISLHLTSSHEDQTLEFMAQEDDLQFREDAIITFVQVQKPTAENESVQVVCETTVPGVENVDNKISSFPIVDNIYDCFQEGKHPAQEAGYGPLGLIRRSCLPSDVHHLFYDRRTRWRSSVTLEEEISSHEFRDLLSPIHRSQLASLLAISHLHTARIRTTCGYPRPAKFRFYHDTNEPLKWSRENPYILNPWLCFGFGARPPKRNIAASSGIAHRKTNPIIELGLLLYQLGSCKVVDYGTGAPGFAKARDNAMKSLVYVDNVVGPNFTEAVAGCLQFRDSPFHGITRKEEEDFVRHIITWLDGLEQYLEGW